MSCRPLILGAAAAILGVACVSSDASAYRAVYRGGAVHRGGYVRPGVAVGVGAAVGAAIVAPRYYNNAVCGYYPNPPCY
jgi:hypothetical protein